MKHPAHCIPPRSGINLYYQPSTRSHAILHLYIAKDHILIAAAYSSLNKHRHSAAHIVVSFGANVTFSVNGIDAEGSGIMIDSNVEHTIMHNTQPMLIFLFNQTTAIAGQIVQFLSGQPYKYIDPSVVDL